MKHNHLKLFTITALLAGCSSPDDVAGGPDAGSVPEPEQADASAPVEPEEPQPVTIAVYLGAGELDPEVVYHHPDGSFAGAVPLGEDGTAVIEAVEPGSLVTATIVEESSGTRRIVTISDVVPGDDLTFGTPPPTMIPVEFALPAGAPEGSDVWVSRLGCGGKVHTAPVLESSFETYMDCLSGTSVTGIAYTRDENQQILGYVAAEDLPLQASFDIDYSGDDWITEFGEVNVSLTDVPIDGYVSADALAYRHGAPLASDRRGANYAAGETFAAQLRLTSALADLWKLTVYLDDGDDSYQYYEQVHGTVPAEDESVPAQLNLTEELMPYIVPAGSAADRTLGIDLTSPPSCPDAGSADYAVFSHRASGSEGSSYWYFYTRGDRLDVQFPDLGSKSAAWWPHETFTSDWAGALYSASSTVDYEDTRRHRTFRSRYQYRATTPGEITCSTENEYQQL